MVTGIKPIAKLILLTIEFLFLIISSYLGWAFKILFLINTYINFYVKKHILITKQNLYKFKQYAYYV